MLTLDSATHLFHWGIFSQRRVVSLKTPLAVAFISALRERWVIYFWWMNKETLQMLTSPLNILPNPLICWLWTAIPSTSVSFFQPRSLSINIDASFQASFAFLKYSESCNIRDEFVHQRCTKNSDFIKITFGSLMGSSSSSDPL